MMDINQFVDRLFEPFRQIRNAVFRVKQAPMVAKAQVNRVKAQVGNVKGDFKSYQQDLKDAKNLPGQAADKVKGVTVVGSGAEKKPAASNSVGNGQAQAQQQQQPPTKKKKFMGLFSKSNKCPSCGQKLHESWQECPYCGWGKSGGCGASCFRCG